MHRVCERRKRARADRRGCTVYGVDLINKCGALCVM